MVSALGIEIKSVGIYSVVGYLDPSLLYINTIPKGTPNSVEGILPPVKPAP